ncbi:MAG TPA: hypothetical protein VD713_01915, partial [Sphingomonadales bacterium]|nr:hypothetical protein [Sphingomonadales bacterium]
ALTGGALALIYLGAARSGIKAANGAVEPAASKNERKKVKIPYGIAIALAGLFVVNNILTFLLA